MHLHTHTEFSMLDGAARISDIVEKALRDGQPAIGITDHGNMYGVLDFYKTCVSNGIKPIIGTEAYMAQESRFDRPTRRGKLDDTGGEGESGEKLYYHLTVLAETTQGYRNLMKLSSDAFLEGYYYKPRIDFELLEKYHEGLIATTGCLGSLVLQALLKGDEVQALKIAGRLQDIFGKESLYVELQDHGIKEQIRTNPMLIELSKKLGAPLLATNDSHYCSREDSEAHDALLCVQTGSTIDDPNRFKFSGTEHYLKSALEMRSLFSELPQACDSSLEIADRASVNIELGKPSLPRFPVPKEFQGESAEQSAANYLRFLTENGAKERYGDPLAPNVKERIEYELRIISDMGFAAYFLVVWDLIRFARENRIRVGPGRGSAAGCCVAYCLKIVDLDPIRYDLLFERFLNPGRKQMPDIDMDFDERYRSDMIKYAAEKYGSDHVAQIVTFSTIKARAAVRDAARVLGLPYGLGDKVAKAMPPLVMGRDTPLSACLTKTEGFEDGFKAAGDLREMYEHESDARRVIEVAKGLEGLRRQDGIHAAAVVITDEPLVEYLPIQRKPEAGGDPNEAPIVTQYEMHGVEDLGLLKMDFLGLRNLSVIERALDLIEDSTGERPDIDRIDLKDEATLAMLRKGDSIGVFQLEGGPMRALMRQLAPTSFDDIAALVALYRPGPMAANMHKDYADRKNGRQAVTYLHEDLSEILKDTYGLMIYQESVMRVAQHFAGYSLEEADNLRKACGKKIRALIQAEREKFVKGCEDSGYGAKLGTELFDQIEPFADYAFNKSHSYGYGLIAYQTAWLKAHFPVQYLAALLTSVKGDKDKSAIYLSECRNQGINVAVPDINGSSSDFTPIFHDGKREILFGLSAVRNVGEGLVEKISAERFANGFFKDFFDFCWRVDTGVLNKRTIESLIKAGAFDSLGYKRQGLCFVYEEIIDRILAKRKEREQGVISLFDAHVDSPTPSYDNVGILIPNQEFDKHSLLAFEKEMLGLYVSDHPLIGLEDALSLHCDLTLVELREACIDEQGEIRRDSGELAECRVGGVITNLSRRTTKRGEVMASFVLEDLETAIEVLVFPKVMAEVSSYLGDDYVVCVKGRVDLRDNEVKIVAREISLPDLTEFVNGQIPLTLRLPVEKMTEEKIATLYDVLSQFPGKTPVRIRLGEKLVELPESNWINSKGGLLAELRLQFGDQVIEPRKNMNLNYA